MGCLVTDFVERFEHSDGSGDEKSFADYVSLAGVDPLHLLDGLV